MRLAKLCITLAFALGGWHGALAAALCARHADCRATAAPRDPHAHQHHPQTAGRDTPDDANAADDHVQTATHAAVDHARAHGHCDTPAGSADAVARDVERETARADENVSSDSGENISDESGGNVSSENGGNVSSGSDENVSSKNDENASPESVADPRVPASPCAHCVGRPTTQPVSVSSVAPSFARDSHAAHAPTRQLVALQPSAARTRFAPPAHSPPRARPLHLLNSALLI